jgi:protein TonB
MASSVLRRYGYGTGVSCLLHLALAALVLRVAGPAPRLKLPPLIETSFVVLEQPAPVAPRPRPVVPPPALPQPVSEPAPVMPAEPEVSAAPAPVMAVTDAPPVVIAAPVDITPATISAAELDDRLFKPLQQPAPEYPWAARSLGLEGKVLVKALVDPDGNVIDQTLVSVTGHPSFGRAAVKAVTGYKFPPPRAQGRPVFVWIEVPIVFVLE